jgi:hypothetical protein
MCAVLKTAALLPGQLGTAVLISFIPFGVAELAKGLSAVHLKISGKSAAKKVHGL